MNYSDLRDDKELREASINDRKHENCQVRRVTHTDHGQVVVVAQLAQTHDQPSTTVGKSAKRCLGHTRLNKTNEAPREPTVTDGRTAAVQPGRFLPPKALAGEAAGYNGVAALAACSLASSEAIPANEDNPFWVCGSALVVQGEILE